METKITVSCEGRSKKDIKGSALKHRSYNIAACSSLFEVANTIGYFKIAEMLHRASEGREVINKINSHLL